MTDADPIRPVCPSCRGELVFSPEQILCVSCGASFSYSDGFPDLILGGRFADEDDEQRTAYETLTLTYLTENYLRPTLRRMFADTRNVKVLSLGCGVGIDIDILQKDCFDIVGIDCGNRSKDWHNRQCRDRLYLANAKHLPFENNAFNLVYCSCVFPHIGVEGDSNRVLPNYWQERLSVASEMTRVLRPGGSIIVSSPNRLFPLDLFHGRNASNPYPRWNPRSSPFLLSATDYRKLFRAAGCCAFQALPVIGYWGFLRMKQTWKGRLLATPVEAIFRAVSTSALGFLRTSPVNPWLVMLMQRS